MLDVSPIPALRDNYIWMIRSPVDPQRVLVVDPGEAEPVRARLAAEDLELAGILITHKHWDHVNGVAELRAEHPQAQVVGPSHPDAPAPDRPVSDGDVVSFAGLDLQFQVLAVPGHTLEHLAYHGHGCVFVGDTLFASGCGRMFEGSPAQMHASLMRLAALPEATWMYCGHEYTVANLDFNLQVLPDDPALAEQRAAAVDRRQRGEPTVPTTIGRERRYNVFLRSEVEAVQAACAAHAGHAMADPVDCFATLRRWKDST